MARGLLSTDAPPEHCLVEILNAEGEAVGKGVVASEKTIVTCAHVVNEALGRDLRTVIDPRADTGVVPRGEIMVRFPYSGAPGDDIKRPMRIRIWLPDRLETFDYRDAASLGMDERIPGGATIATLVDANYHAGSVTLFGLRPRGATPGASAYVTGQFIGELPNEGRYQVNQDKLPGNIHVRSGASGSPVWDTATRQVIGLVQAIPKSGDAIDVYVLVPELIEEATGGELYQARECPYVGLKPYKQADSDRFFGREEFVKELIESARTQSLLVVSGISGGGKSSAVLAGLVPKLVEESNQGLAVGTCELSDTPLTALAGAFCRAESGVQPLAERVDYWKNKLAGESLGECGSVLLAATGQQRLLLVLDHFERIGNCEDDTTKNRFLQLLADLGHSQLGQVQAIIIVRSDRYAKFMDMPGPLGPLLRATRPNWVPDISEDDLRSIILGPLAAYDIQFEKELVREICRDFRGSELPTLQVVLTELWSMQVARKITLSAYRQLGGVGEVLARWADGRFDQLLPDQQAAAKRILTSLAVPGTGDITRPARKSDLEADWAICEELSALRLIVIKRTDVALGEEIVEIAHEALLRGWERLREWRREDESFLRWQSRLRDRRDEWESRERDPSLLLTGPLLLHALEMQDAHLERTVGLAEFISASKQLHQRHVDRLEAIRLAGIGEHLLNSASGRLPSSLFLGALALRREGVFEADFVIRRALALLGRPAHPAIRHAKPVRRVAFNSDGTLLASASGDGDCVVWDTTTGREVARLPHDGGLTTVAFSPDDQYVVTAGFEGIARLWDYRAMAVKWTLDHEAPVATLAFSLRGAMLATADNRRKARIWRYEVADAPLVLLHEEPVNAVAFDPGQGAYLVTVSDSLLRIWDPGSGQETGSFSVPPAGIINSISLSSDGAMLAVACSDRSARIFKMDSHEMVHRLMHQSGVTGVAFSHDGRYLATAVADRTARVWDVEGAYEVAHLTHDEPVSSIGFSPDSTHLATTVTPDVTARVDRAVGQGGTAHVWNVATGKEAARLVQEDTVNQAVFSPRGDLIATASDDHTARAWHVLAGAEKALLAHGEPVNAIAFSPAGDLVATAGREDPAAAYPNRGTTPVPRTVRIWAAVTGEETCDALPHPAAVQGLAFGASAIATACDDGHARLWGLEGGRLLGEFQHDGPVQWVSFNPGSTLLATASNDSTARIWDVERKAQVSLLRHSGWVGSVVFDPAGQLLATAADDKYARIWRVADCLSDGNPQPIARLKHDGAVFRANFDRVGNKVITVGNDRTARLWKLNAATNAPSQEVNLDHLTAVHVDSLLIATAGDEGSVRVIRADTAQEVAHFVHEPAVRSLAFDQAGNRLATTGKDGSVRIWSIFERAEVARLIHGGEDPIVAFSPDDMSAATASEDGTARIWPLGRTALFDQARERITRNLYRTEWSRYLPELPYEMLRLDLGDPSGT